MRVATQACGALMRAGAALSLALVVACGADEPPAAQTQAAPDPAPAVAADEAVVAPPTATTAPAVDDAQSDLADEAVRKALEAERLEYEQQKEQLNIVDEDS